jgi:hypothetical protein
MSMMRDEAFGRVKKKGHKKPAGEGNAEEGEGLEQVFSAPLNDRTYIAGVDGSNGITLEAEWRLVEGNYQG